MRQTRPHQSIQPNGDHSRSSSRKGAPKLNLRVWLSLLGLTTGLALERGMISPPAVQAQTTPAGVEEGYALLKKGWVNDAIAAFQQALRRSPNSLPAKLGLATAYQRAGQDANAWQAYQRVLAQDANNKTALAAMGLLGTYRPEWQAKGIETLTQLLQLSPNDTTARARRALLYGYQGRFAESIADYQLLLQGNPSPDVLLGAAQIYSYSGDYTQGLALFNRYRSTGKAIPDNAVTAYAACLRETGNATQAVEILTTRLQPRKQLDALTIELRAALAVAYQANGQSDAALAALQPLRNQPKAILPLARSLSTIGRQTKNLQLYSEAIALYRQVLTQTTAPSPGLVTEIADVLSEYPPTRAESLQLYQRLITQQPNNRSLLIKQLAVENLLGQTSREAVRERLLSVLQPLPAADGERRAIAQALIQLDPPDVELLPIYQELIQSRVDVPFLNFRVAQMLIEQGNFAEARQALANYSNSALGAKDVATELLLADLDRRESNYAESVRRYQTILAQNPTAAIRRDALWGLAGVFQAQGRAEEALQIYSGILAENPQDPRAQLGQLYLTYQAKRVSDGKASNKLDELLNGRTVEPYPELYGLAAALPADPKREALYRTLLEYDPDNIGIERRLIQVIAKRSPEEAQTRVNQILERDRNNVYAYFVQGELAQATGDLELASQAYQQILQKESNNVDALSALGGIRFQQRRYTEATEIYQQILAFRPNDLETRRVLAELLLAQDKPVTGLQQLRQVQQEQAAKDTENPAVNERVQEVQVDLLKRRGFQPDWERY
jgi:cellulose synthase operon protein C